MRSVLVLLAVMIAVALLLPVSETKAVPLSGITLVGEARASTPDLIAAGKNGNTGKNGQKNGHGGSSGAGSAGQAAGAIGGFGTFLGANRHGGMGSPELVPVALR